MTNDVTWNSSILSWLIFNETKIFDIKLFKLVKRMDYKKRQYALSES